MERILAALDDKDETSRHIFNQALKLAQATQGCLNLLHVLPPPSDPGLTFSPYSDRQWLAYTESYRAAELQSFKFLQGLTNQAKTAEITAEFTQRTGSPGPAICELARTWEATLIIIGSHGRKGLTEMLLGSVSNYVVHHATCSVMVIHNQSE